MESVQNKAITDVCNIYCVFVNQSGCKIEIEIEIEFVKADELQMGYSTAKQHSNARNAKGKSF